MQNPINNLIALDENVTNFSDGIFVLLMGTFSSYLRTSQTLKKA